MKKYNFNMERLLARVYRNGVTPYCPQRIWEKRTLDGNPFWGIGNFCGIGTDAVTQYGKELTDLEWQGNELFFPQEEKEQLEQKVAASYLALKKQMEEEYPDVIFDLIVSVDEELHTGTIRFYAVRDGYHYIEPDREYGRRLPEEASLIETVNEIHPEQYLPLLKERLERFPISIQHTGKKEIRIQDMYSESCIDLCWDEEFTMYFDGFHAHYGEEDWEELLDDIEQIVTGKLAAGRIESGGRWLGSCLLETEGLSAMSDKQLLQRFFGTQKCFYHEVKQNGGEVTITEWGVRHVEPKVIDRKKEV